MYAKFPQGTPYLDGPIAFSCCLLSAGYPAALPAQLRVNCREDAGQFPPALRCVRWFAWCQPWRCVISYLLALHTGLRRGEMNALRWSHLHLDAPNPFYSLPAGSSKNRKEQPRPLHPELVAELQTVKADGKVTPEAMVFPERVPVMKVIHQDFKAAGIHHVDERGHKVDFHALRMTFITRLQRAGVSPREAMELARHSDMRLTMKVYTDVAQLPLAASIRQLPAFSTKRDDTQTLVPDSPCLLYTSPSPRDRG